MRKIIFIFMVFSLVSFSKDLEIITAKFFSACEENDNEHLKILKNEQRKMDEIYNKLIQKFDKNRKRYYKLKQKLINSQEMWKKNSVEEMKDYNNNLEVEADRFAMDYLIPPEEYKKLEPTRYTSDNEIKEFAKKIGIHPGIVAGRLQHEGIIAQNRCSKLKEKYVIKIKHIE